MASFVYNRGAKNLQNNSIVWASDTIKARLVKSTATVNKDDTSMTGHTTITGSTDQTLGSKTFTEDTTNDRIVYDAADSTWTAVASGETVQGIDIFQFVSNDAGSTPIAFIDITDLPTNGGDITLQWATTGLFYTQE